MYDQLVLIRHKQYLFLIYFLKVQKMGRYKIVRAAESKMDSVECKT